MQNHIAEGVDIWILRNLGHFYSSSTTLSFYSISSTRGKTSMSTCHAPYTALTIPLHSTHNSWSVFGVFVHFLKKWHKPLYNTGFRDKVVFWVRQVTTGNCCVELFYAGRHICPMGYQNPRNNRSRYNEVLLHMLALNLDSKPCQVSVQLLASDLFPEG